MLSNSERFCSYPELTNFLLYAGNNLGPKIHPLAQALAEALAEALAHRLAEALAEAPGLLRLLHF